MSANASLPKLIIFDKDGTLVSGFDDRPANTIAEQHLLPHVGERCEALREAGHTLAVASNQGGVAFGFISKQRAEELVEHAASLIGATAWEVCLHHPKGRIKAYRSDCECRKPKPGMILTLMERLGFSKEETMFVGDMDTDEQAAQAAGVRFMWAKELFGWGEAQDG